MVPHPFWSYCWAASPAAVHPLSHPLWPACLGATLAGQGRCPGVIWEHVYAAENKYGPIIGYLLLITVDQVILQLFPRARHDFLSLGKATSYEPVQCVTFLSSLEAVSLRLMTSQSQDIVNHKEKYSQKNSYFDMYGFKILCEILNPCTAKYAFYEVFKI